MLEQAQKQFGKMMESAEKNFKGNIKLFKDAMLEAYSWLNNKLKKLNLGSEKAYDDNKNEFNIKIDEPQGRTSTPLPHEITKDYWKKRY
jgi:uncharacterized FlaG/YvyC family protein